MIPKDHIDFDAISPWFLVGDLRKLPKEFLSEPPLTKKFSDDQLIAFGNQDIELPFPFIKCHNVAIEAAVKQTTIANKKGTNHDDALSYLLHTQDRLENIPTDYNKSHFIDKD